MSNSINDLIAKLKKIKDDTVSNIRNKSVNPISSAIINNFIPEKNGVTGIRQIENIPEVTIPKISLSNSNPVVNTALKIPQFVANLPSTFAESTLNTPGYFLKGIARTGNYLGDVSEGKQLFSPFKLAANYAPTANAILNVATMKVGGNAINNLGKQTFKNAVISNAIPGTKIGAGFGGLNALENSRDQTFQQALPNIAVNTIGGGIVGGVVGGGLGGAGYGFKKLFSDFNPQSTIKNESLKVNEPTQLKLNDSRASSEVPIKPFTYDKNAYNPLSDNTKDVAKLIFGDNRVPTSKRGIGAAEQIRSNDNLLLSDQKVVDYLNKIDVKKKVNLLDYIRTPENVLKKFGLESEGKALRNAQESYTKELKNEIGRVSAWEKRVPGIDSSKRIFQFLDGDKIKLDSQEMTVAIEIKDYLSKWADRLDVPYESRLTNYITHIFEKGDVELEFNPDIAKMIEGKVSGSVYDPFLQKRGNTSGYVTDVWRALDAYVKRATRKVNFDPALDRVQVASDKLDLDSYKYVQKYISGINMRPTDVDNLLDNSIKSVFGYKLGNRPTAYTTGKARRIMSRAMLGLNPGSALRNLSQGANTYAVLGEKYTVKGYYNLAKKMATNNLDELYDVGVLEEGLIQDRSTHAVKPLMEKLDPILYSMFEWAEKVNRGAAYFGAKAKGLASGMTDKNAMEYAKSVVRRTQFSFSKIDTPVALQSDLAKTALQFGTYSLKQAEFLMGMTKDKDFAGLARYTGASLLFMATLGKLIGMKTEQLIPSISLTPPVVQLGENAYNIYSSAKEEKAGKTIQNIMKTGSMIIPAGSQLKKSYEGLKTVGKGYSESPTGLIEFPVEQSISNYVRGGLFGKYNLPENQKYFDSDNSALSEKQSLEFKNSTDKNAFYKKTLNSREIKANLTGDGYYKSTDAPKSNLSKAFVVGKSIITDPLLTIKAALQGNPIRKVENGFVVLERRQGLGQIDSGNKDTEVDHITPLEFGGVNSSKSADEILAETKGMTAQDKKAYLAKYNLESLSIQEHKIKTKVQSYLSDELKSKNITKKEAKDKMDNWRNILNSLPINVQEALANDLSVEESTTKTTKSNTKTKTSSSKKYTIGKVPSIKDFSYTSIPGIKKFSFGTSNYNFQTPKMENLKAINISDLKKKMKQLTNSGIRFNSYSG